MCLNFFQFTDTTFKEKKRTKIQRIRWTGEQKLHINEFFEDHIKNKKVPRKHEVEELMEKHKRLFRGKMWVQIKAHVYNCYKKK